jgi:hypothetical protein
VSQQGFKLMADAHADLGLPSATVGEAYMRVFSQVTDGPS